MDKVSQITETDEWQNADIEYADVISRDMFPFFGGKLTDNEKVGRYLDIIKMCPIYYPAQLTLGNTYLSIGKDKKGIEQLDAGFQVVKDFFEEEDMDNVINNVGDYLEKNLKFDLAIRYYQKALEMISKKGWIYDSMAYCYTMLGNFKEALKIQQKALDYDPGNSKYYSNAGWINMCIGNMEDAKILLKKSLKLNPDDDVTKGNYDALKCIVNKKLKNWDAYLLRKMDKYEYKDMEDEDFIKEIAEYNVCRLDAFKVEIVRGMPEYTIKKKVDLLLSIQYFFKNAFRDEFGGFDDDFFLYDDINELNFSFERRMKHVIDTTKDIDETIFNDIYTGLTEFYKFMTKKRLTTKDNFEKLKKTMELEKDDLYDKMMTKYKKRKKDTDEPNIFPF